MSNTESKKKVPVTWQIDENVKEAIDAISGEWDRSINWTANHILKKFAEDHKKAKDDKSNLQ